MSASVRSAVVVNRDGAPLEVTLHLAAINELFEGASASLDAPTPSTRPGIERVLGELIPQRLDHGVRLNVLLPGAGVKPGLDRVINAAITRWCHQRRRENDYALRALHRDGISALLPGTALLAVGLLAGAASRRSPLPEDVQILGEGLAIVIAWVAMWYPLDTLFYSRRPYRRENKVLDAMTRMEITITPAPPRM